MKKLLMMLTLMIGALNLNAQGVTYAENPMDFNHDDAVAIVLVHHGTALQQVRTLTFNAMTRQMKDQFRGSKVVELHLNPTVGVRAKSVEQTLDELYYDGITHVIFQPTYVSYNGSWDKITSEAEPFNSKFKDIRVAKPLIYDADDCAAVAEALKGEVTTSSDAVVLVANSKFETIEAVQPMMETALKTEEMNNWFVASSQDVAESLTKSGAKSVTLVPFFFTSGVETAGDITTEMKATLESKGFTVELFTKGLGEVEAIRKVYATHIDYAFTHK